MRETILLIHFEDEERARKIKLMAMSLKMRIVQVKKKDYLQSVGYLAGVKGMEEKPEKYEGEELEKEMMVFAGLGSQKLDEALKAMRKAGIRVEYKAILTETNCTWSVPELYRELAVEHEAMKGMEK